MNCYEFTLADTVDFRYTIQSEVCNGDVIIRHVGPDVYNRRLPQCIESNRFRQDAFCNRFKLLNFDFDTSNLDAPVRSFACGPYAASNMFPRPWDETDPFYARAAAIWDELEAKDDGLNKGASGNFFSEDDFFYYWHFEHYQNGEIARIYSQPGFDVGQITLTIQRNDPPLASE